MLDEDDALIRYYGTSPRLVENRIIECFPKNISIQIQSSNDKYLRLKLTPTPEKRIIEGIGKKFGLEIETFNSDESCILEIQPPEFDVVAIRDSNFPRYTGWILQIVHHIYYSSGAEIIAAIQYNEDHPYGLQIAEHLVEYLNQNKDELQRDYKEIYTI